MTHIFEARNISLNRTMVLLCDMDRLLVLVNPTRLPVMMVVQSDCKANKNNFLYLRLVEYLCFYTWCCPPRWRTWRHRERGRLSSASPCGCSRSGKPFPESEVNIILKEENAFTLWHQNPISKNGNITKWNIHKPKAIFWKESLQALNIFKSFIAVYEKFNNCTRFQMI